MTNPQAPGGQGSQGQGSQGQSSEHESLTEPPHLRLVRGAPSPEELSALITVVAALSGSGDEDPDHTEQGAQRRRSGGSLWNAPSRMVGMTNLPGHGGWRASAYPR